MTVVAAPDADLIWREWISPEEPVPTFNVAPSNINMVALAAVGNGQLATLVPLAQTPATQYAYIYVDGVLQNLGGLTDDCYFSSDGGVTAKTLGPGGTLAPGDLLYWNALIAGFALAPTDRITAAYFYVT